MSGLTGGWVDYQVDGWTTRWVENCLNHQTQSVVTSGLKSK